jgi:lipopolysaccharide transport system permease protein
MNLTTSKTADVLEPSGPAQNFGGGRDAPGQAAPRAGRKPLVLIKPSGARSALNLREVWAYRELLYFLTWRDVKVRYKQTALGAAWAVLQPLLMMIIFTLFFGRLAGIASDGVPYPLFAYAGLLPWMFFANATTNSGNSVVGSANLVSKIYFPRMIIPAATVGAGLVDLLIGFLMLGPLMAYYGVAPRWSMLMLPPLVLLTALFAFGVGMWMAALNVRYRDVRFALPFLVQLWMFASPVIYPLSSAPPQWQWVLKLNPMAGVIQGFRSALFGHAFDWPALALSAAVASAVFVYSAHSFRRMERSFADIV